ncbi:MAG: carbon-nitrogen hydrolase family protein [Catenulispora sp.]
MRTLAIAAIQTAPVPHDVEASWERFATQVRSTHELFPHVQLVVVPELLLAAEGPLLAAAPADGMEQTATSIPGPVTDRICALAVETGLWLVPGSVFERGADGNVYNTALAVSPDGRIAARYRKVFPWKPYEQTAPGSEFVVFDIPDAGRVGLAICYDGSFPETMRQLAWLGAEVVLHPTLTTTRDRDMELVCARANAWTNQIFIVNVNGSDPVGVGMSVIVDPEGIVRQQAGAGEEILVDVLDLDTVTRVRRYGSSGMNRPWQQLGRYGQQIKLPMYGGSFQTPEWLSTNEGTSQ